MLNLNSLSRGSRFSLLAVITTMALFSAMAFAQSTVGSGSITGTVTDPTGAVVNAAKVTITNTGTGQVINLTTNSAGTFNSGSLTPGEYRAQASAKGFSTTSEIITVQVNNTANFSPKLQVGQESQIVEVQGNAVEVNTEQAEVQGVLTANQIESLPVNGRNFLDLAQLEPGVQIQDGANFDPTKVGYSSISFGSRFGRSARIDVDGVDVSDETVGTTTEDIPASSIQEFSLAQSSLDLSNDLTSSGAVNVTTKSGTNVYHGEAYGAFRDSSEGAALPSPANPLTANPLTGLGPAIPSPYQRSQEGGNFGGPILKDKLFFFIDGEHTLQHLAAPVAESAPFTSYSGTFGAPFKEGELMARVDYELTKTTRVFARYNYFQNSVAATYFPSSFQLYDNKNYTRNDVFGVDFNTGSFTHSIRFSYLKFQNQIADATRGSDLPFANYPVSINIGGFTVGPNLLAPQSTPQSDHQLKYDGSKILGKHILRFGVSWNHIQGGGFASFFRIDPSVYGNTPATSGDPTADTISYAIVGNGQGYSTTEAALGFPAGGLGPDNRMALYFGDTWKVLPNLSISPGVRWERDTGRTDSDLGAIAPLNAAFPGYGNPVRQANKNFAPQLGIAWDVTGKGKTVVRAGAGLYYENVIYNNVLFDRPFRLQNGAFLSTPLACLGGSAQPVSVPSGTITIDSVEGLDSNGHSFCSDTIAQAASPLAAFETYYQAQVPFSVSAPNPNYIGNGLAAGLNYNSAGGAGLFAPNYKTPRALQMNIGIQHEIRRGMVVSADYLRNVETHALLNVDINQVGAARHFNPTQAAAAVNATVAACGASSLQGAITSPAQGGQGCAALNGVDSNNNAIPANITNFTNFGLGSALDTGAASACPTGGCAFSGINPNYGQMSFLEPISRSVYNALQMKLVQNVANPMRGVKTANFQIAYSLSRFINPMGSQGNAAPSNPVAGSDQDFVLQASDNDNPLKYMGPSLLDRTHQFSFGGSFDVPYGFRFGLIAHFYSPLSSPVIIGDTGSGGQIFQTDFTGSGSWSDPLPGTTNGSFERDFGLNGLNSAITKYNNTQGNQATPAGQVLINSGLFNLSQLQTIGAVAPSNLATAASNQLLFPWLKATDFKLSWKHTFFERLSVEPNVGFYNVFNFANSNLPPGAMTGWLNEGAGSINSIAKGSAGAIPFRVGAGTGVFGLGAPRALEWGLRLTF
ncbi:MAG: carboxypeptidase regulatory-like domain-containing protein [Terriglobales bacterium]